MDIIFLFLFQITVMVWDTLISDELVCQNFNNLENVDVIPSLKLDVPCLQEAGQNIGNLVFIVIKGKHCAAYLKGMELEVHQILKSLFLVLFWQDKVENLCMFLAGSFVD